MDKHYPETPFDDVFESFTALDEMPIPFDFDDEEDEDEGHEADDAQPFAESDWRNTKRFRRTITRELEELSARAERLAGQHARFLDCQLVTLDPEAGVVDFLMSAHTRLKGMLDEIRVLLDLAKDAPWSDVFDCGRFSARTIARRTACAVEIQRLETGPSDPVRSYRRECDAYYHLGRWDAIMVTLDLLEGKDREFNRVLALLKQQSQLTDMHKPGTKLGPDQEW